MLRTVLIVATAIQLHATRLDGKCYEYCWIRYSQKGHVVDSLKDGKPWKTCRCNNDHDVEQLDDFFVQVPFQPKPSED